MPPLEPGEGPARYFARAGFAGIEVDGPIGGLRNTTGGDEQFLVFNVGNISAMRDNIRESAMELDVIAHVGVGLQLDASACPGASATASFDATHVAIMGHSMGAWIAPLVLASEPAFGAAILSGAGGSYVANIIDKQKPTPPAGIIAALLDYRNHDYQLDRHDPGLTLLQWAAEPSDPQAYTADIVHPPAGTAPRSLLMLQGIVDHYILPSIADATSLSLGLDEAGPAYDGDNAELASLGQPVLAPLLPLIGRAQIGLPATANIDAHTTAVVVQHPGDAIEDGHEVVFQTEPPKHQYRCFLASWLASGAPTVPADGSEDAPCP
jgi:pimeloyl-ACP methyl ester carboxylesterase